MRRSTTSFIATCRKPVNFSCSQSTQAVGFVHTAFTFAQESYIGKADIHADAILPGMLVTMLQKGLHYTSIEFHLNDDGTEKECTKPYSLLEPHVCEKTQPPLRSTTPSAVIKRDIAPKERSGSAAVGNFIEKKERENGKKRKKDSSETPSKPPSKKIVPAESATKDSTEGTVKKRRPSIKPELPSFLSKEIRLLTGHESEVITCAWNPSPSINLLASASGDGTVRMWTVPSVGDWNLEEAKISVKVLEHIIDGADVESRDVTTIGWSCDGKYLATGCYDGKARIWSADGDLLAVLEKHRGPIFQLQWSPDGQHLVTTGVEPSVIVWNIASRTLHREYEHHSAPALDVDWRDNQSFATCSTDKLIHVYSIEKEDPLLTLSGHQDEVNSIKWSPDGKLLVSSSDDTTARIWKISDDLKEGDVQSILSEHTMEIYTAKWCSSNGKLLIATASFDGTIKIWDGSSGTGIYTLKHHTQPVYAIDFSSCGKYIASGSLDETLLVWRLQDGQLIRGYKDRGSIFEVIWSPTGDRIAACTSDATLCVLDFNVALLTNSLN